MKGVNVRHSKLKNTGILFETLVRQVISEAFNGSESSQALKLLRKYFSVNTELGKEFQLYQNLFNAGKLSESRAIHLIDLVLMQRKKLDEKKLAREKYNLIKELKETYDIPTLFSCKIPTYKLYASIYVTFLTETKYTNNTILNIHDVASAKFTLIEYLLRTNPQSKIIKENAVLEELRNQTEDLRLLAYRISLNKFNEKYESLSEEQKMLLSQYINNVSNTSALVEYVKKQAPTVKSKLLKGASKLKNQVLQIKINEVAKQINKIGTKSQIKDSEITAMMIAYEIIKELENDNG